MSREKNLAKNTIILSFGTFLPKLTSLITVPIITGHLTKIEYGTYDLITTLVSLLLPVVTLQIQSAAFRFLIECRDDDTEKKKVISNIYIFIIPISIVALIILFFVLYQLSSLMRLLIAIYFFVDIIMMATQQIVRGLSKNKLFSISAVIQSTVNMLLIILTLTVADQGLYGVLISIIIATVISLVFLIIKGGIIKEIDLSLKSFNTIKQMLRYSWPMVPNTLSNWVLSTSDRFVLTIFMGLEAVAIYGVANKIPQLLIAVQGTFIFAWQENASLAISDDDVEKYYSKMFDKIFCIITGAMAILIAATPVLFWLLIKGDYNEAYPQMTVLFMGMFFSTLAAFLGGIYVAHKKTKSVGITTMIAAGINLAIDFALVNTIGIYAASISTLVSYLFLAIYRMRDVKKFQPISYRYKKIAVCLGALALMCVLCWMNTLVLNIINMAIGCTFAILLNRNMLKGILKTLKSKLHKGR